MRENEGVKALAHGFRQDEMVDLQGDFGALLRKAAGLEGVGKLGLLTDTEEQLRLGDEAERLEATRFCHVLKGGEVNVGGDVLLAGGFVGIR